MVAILSEIMDKLHDIDQAMQENDNNDEVTAQLSSLYDFVAVEETEALRTAWFKRMGVLS